VIGIIVLLQDYQVKKKRSMKKSAENRAIYSPVKKISFASDKNVEK
jgi:hypothetical protein